MIKKGIGILNSYLYEWMTGAREYKPLDDTGLQITLKLIECWGGVLGFRPVMEPYIPDQVRRFFVERINQYNQREREQLISQTERSEQYGRDRQGGGRDPDMMLRLRSDNPHLFEEFTLSDIPITPGYKYLNPWRKHALKVGFTQHDLDLLFEWRVRPADKENIATIGKLVNLAYNMGVSQEYGAEYDRNRPSVYKEYMKRFTVAGYASWMIDHNRESPPAEYMQKVNERIVWQSTELQHFIIWCVKLCGITLAQTPIKIASGKYEETLKVERTQADIINEMSQELSNLPRFTAYAKIIEEKDGRQVVSRHKIKTIEMPRVRKSELVMEALVDSAGNPDPVWFPHSLKEGEMETRIINRSQSAVYKSRESVEEEIKKRQEKWRGAKSEEPPPAGNKEQPSFPVAPTVIQSEEPPPTGFLSRDKSS